MTKKYTFLFALSFLFLLTACEKESLDSQQLTVQAQKISQDVVFHYAYTDEVAEQEYGWFINKKGEVKSYSTRINDDAIPNDKICQKDELEQLNLIAQTLQTTVELTELENHFEFIKKASIGDLSILQTTEEISSQYSYFAYKKVTVTHEADRGLEGCSGAGCMYTSTTFFERVLLETGGSQTQTNTSVSAETILAWLKTIEQDVEL